MKSSSLLIILVILVLAAVGYYGITSLGKSTMESNSEILKSGKTLEVTAEEVSYFKDTKGYFIMPKTAGTYPGIVVIHENRGLRPEIKTTAEELAKEGYMVLAVDLYGGAVFETQDEARAFSPKYDQEKGVENMRAAVAFLKEKGATKVGSLGWCFGGRQSVNLSISGEKLDATVVYYGSGIATTTDALKPITWPVLGIFGGKDQAIPVETVKAFETSLTALGVENEIHIYPDVGHAFANPSGANYAPKETKDAWEKTITFLNKNLRGE